MLIHIGTGSLHLRIFGDRLLKVKLPVCGFRPLFQLGHLLKGLVCTALLVVLVVPDGGFGHNLCPVGGLHAGVFLFNFMDFAVNVGGKGIADFADGLVRFKLQFALPLWNFQLILKVQAGFAFAGFLIKDALFFQHLFGGQLFTSGVQTLMRLLGLALQPLNPTRCRGIAAKVRHFCGSFSRLF